MKKLLFFLFAFPIAMLFPGNANAQFALFVDDNGVFSYNTDTVLSSLNGAGIQCDVFNARDSLRSPTAAEMQAYEIVIWYCSTDGVDNYFWNGDDTDNNEIMLYLENGGKLWLMGTDFLYDRYGAAPDVFVPGDFVYDYLGISDYVAQSYGDDGGLGVPQLDPVLFWSANPPPTIYWTFPTAWWVDGCTPVGNAVSLYNMGPDTYPLYGLSSAVYNHYDFQASEKEVTFFFDPAIMDTYHNRVNLFWWTFNTLFMPPPGFGELTTAKVNLISRQVTGTLQCEVPESVTGGKLSVNICDITGKLIFSHTVETQTEFSVDISSLKPGMFVLSVSDNKNVYYQKFVISK